MKVQKVVVRDQDGVLHVAELGGTGEAGTVAELDLEGSTVGGEKLAKYVGRRGDLTPGDPDDTELTVTVSDRFLKAGEGDGELVGPVLLRVKAEEDGKRRGTVRIGGMEGLWQGETRDLESPGGIYVPVRFNFDSVGKQALLTLTVTSGDGKTQSRYALQVIRQSSDSTVKSIRYGIFYDRAEPELDGRGEQVCLSLAQARERYGSMEDRVARYAPWLSCGMTAREEGYYFDAQGGPIRRAVYRGWLSGGEDGVLADAVHVEFSGKNASATAQIYGPDGQLVQGRVNLVSGDYPAGIRENSLTLPLTAVRDTGDWDRVCARVYGQVRAEDGSMTYAVLELYNARTGNYRIGRMEGDGPVPAGRKPEPGKDVYGIWAYEDQAMAPLLGPNALAGEDECDSAPACGGENTALHSQYDPPEDYYPVPTAFHAAISPEAEKVHLTVRTEDPGALVTVGYERQDGEAAPVEYPWVYYQGKGEFDLTFPPGQPPKVHIHVKDKNQRGADQKPPSQAAAAGAEAVGREYLLHLECAPVQRELTALELLDGEGNALGTFPLKGEDGTRLETVEVPVAAGADGPAVLRLTGSAGTRIYLFRPKTGGDFDTGDPRYVIPVFSAGDLSQAADHAAGTCYARLPVPQWGAQYRVVAACGAGLGDPHAIEYALKLTRTEVEA